MHDPFNVREPGFPQPFLVNPYLVLRPTHFWWLPRWPGQRLPAPAHFLLGFNRRPELWPVGKNPTNHPPSAVDNAP